MVPLRTVLREWGRIGCLGFGGPPTHIRMLRELCVERRGWIDAHEFEDAIAACNLLPGPASTQLSIWSAWRLRGWRGALVGGLAFILPGLVLILALAALFLGSPPAWVVGAGTGAGAAVAAVAVQAAWALTPPSWQRAAARWRWLAYAVAGGAASALLGAWVVLVLLGCGLVELGWRHPWRRPGSPATQGLVAPALLWTAFKVGALSYGGGFVIIPLMQSDAVARYHWMSSAEFLNAVALGQVTPGPVVHTVAVVGWGASGLTGGLVAALIAFGPSFVFVLVGGRHFERLRTSRPARAFLDGAGPAAIGAIYGAAVPLARALDRPWEYAVLAGAAVVLLGLRRGVVPTLLAGAAVGVVVAVHF